MDDNTVRMKTRPESRIVVRNGSAERIFYPGSTVTIGRAPHMSVVVDDPLVSRDHAVLTWDDGWTLADNGSANGVFVHGDRIAQPVPIDTEVEVRLGDRRTGPVLTVIPQQDDGEWDLEEDFDDRTIVGSNADRPPVRRAGPASAVGAVSPAASEVQRGGLSIGRTAENHFAVDDPLASRRHAKLVSASDGLAIEDLGSVNGTFVNGVRTKYSLLREGDVVTVGNTDFVVSSGTLEEREPFADQAGIALHGVGFVIEGDKQLLVDVTMSAAPGSLTAVIGPSGAGKSTLAKIIAGSAQPSAGVVEFEGRNLHAEFQSLRSRIGLVPQDDVLHRLLTVRQALRYAAELRLPTDTTREDRERVIDGVLDELSLTSHAETRIDRLSGGQRKRASVALELLTSPTLLILDEPTSGLDPALDRQVMALLRQLADGGRVVLVVTHSVAYLDMCDQVLLLAPGGKTAFCGHPGGVEAALGSSDWAEIYDRVTLDPDRAFAAHQKANPPEPVPERGEYEPPGRPPHTSFGKQASTVARRQLRLIRADRGYLIFLIALPFVLGVISSFVSGDAGLAGHTPNDLDEALQILVLLVLGACFMGLTLTIRDLVGERTIYHRERAVGLLAPSYLVAKIGVFAMVTTLQSAILVGIVLMGKPGPGSGALLRWGGIEIFVAIASTAIACVVTGLLLSSVARSSEQVMPMLVVMIMLQLVMSGGLIDITGRPVLSQVSWLFPGRWGFAATASTTDLLDIGIDPRTNKGILAPDALWQHTGSAWLLDIAMLGVICIVLGAATLDRLRLRNWARPF